MFLFKRNLYTKSNNKKTDLKILAVIPARGGSKAIPGKNIRVLGSRPLIEYTFDAAKASVLLDRIILSTDDKEIARIGKENKIEVPFFRPAQLAEDNSPTLPVIQHAVNFLEENDNYKADIIIILQPTSPLRRPEHIDEALEILIDTKADSVVSVTELPHQYNPYSVLKTDNGRLIPFIEEGERYTQRQQKPLLYARNGASIYAFKYETLINEDSLYGNDCRPYIMNKADSIDIDDMADFELAECILGKRERHNE